MTVTILFIVALAILFFRPDVVIIFFMRKYTPFSTELSTSRKGRKTIFFMKNLRFQCVLIFGRGDLRRRASGLKLAL